VTEVTSQVLQKFCKGAVDKMSIWKTV